MSKTSLFGRLLGLYSTACAMLAHLNFLAPLLGRIVIAAVFIPSGWGKLHSLAKVIDFFTSLGIPFPEYQAPFVACVELIGGIFVLLGLGTRLASFLLINTMVVAIVTAIWPDVSGVADFFSKDEVLYSAILAHLIIAGGGAVSLDALIGRVTAGAPARVAGVPRSVHA